MYKFLVRGAKGKVHFGDLDIDGMVILKPIFKKQVIS
jgi:hypothetical protein